MVVAHLSQDEKEDLETFLSTHTSSQGEEPWKWTKSTKNFALSLLGKEALDESLGAINVSFVPHMSVDRDGKEKVDGFDVLGFALPGDSVEFINMSKAPQARLHIHETEVLGIADDQGILKSSKNIQADEGDMIRFRRKDLQGNVSNWMTMQVETGNAIDSINASINMNRLES